MEMEYLLESSHDIVVNDKLNKLVLKIGVY